jgi:hypothetical protein
MENFTQADVEAHWRSSAVAFQSEYRIWIEVFWDIVFAVTEVLRLLEAKNACLKTAAIFWCPNHSITHWQLFP